MTIRSDINEYLLHTAAIVYLIDGTKYDANAIAEYALSTLPISRNLYDLFVNPTFVAHPCPLLLAVNKSDLCGCADNQTVYDAVENQLLERRGGMTCRNLLKESYSADGSYKLGQEGKKFAFENDSPCPVFACNCSVKTNHYQKISGFIAAALH